MTVRRSYVTFQTRIQMAIQYGASVGEKISSRFIFITILDSLGSAIALLCIFMVSKAFFFRRLNFIHRHT